MCQHSRCTCADGLSRVRVEASPCRSTRRVLLRLGASCVHPEWCEAAAEFLYGTEDRLFGCVGSDVECGGDLFGGTSFHVAEDEGGALGGGETLHGAGLEGFDLLAKEESLGIGGGVGDLHLMLGGVCVFGDLIIGVGFSFVLHIEGTVDGDAVDPGSELGARLEAFKLLIAAEEGFLNDLFGVGLVAGDAEGYAEDSRAVAYDELAVGLFVSGENRPDDRVVVLFHSAH